MVTIGVTPYNRSMTTLQDGATKTLLLVSDDLMFPSRVREGLRPLGYALRVVATEAAALEAAGQPDAALDAILVNLTARRYDAPQLIRALKASDTTRAIPLLAFAGHVEKDKHEAARAAGADMVAANSSVSMHLAALLSRLLNDSSLPDDETLEEV
jgi:CheY-like chemotaxis protein